jgi:ribokinase
VTIHNDPSIAPVILVVGSTMIDLIAYADRLPNDGETLVGRDFRMGFGGKGANQAVAAARFGARVAMVNTLGDDTYGDQTLENFVAQGVDTTFVTRASGPSGVAPIWVDASGRNRIICVPGANDLVPPELAVLAVETLRPGVVVGQFEIPQPVTRAAFEAARATGAITVLNPAPAADVDPGVLAVTDWLVPNEHELLGTTGVELTGDVRTDGARLAARGHELGLSLGVTLGERGALVVPLGGEPQAVDAPAVTAVDTTGAGDAWVGAFAVALALGATPGDAARLGCAFAADSVTRPGTQASLAGRDDARRLLAAVLSS